MKFRVVHASNPNIPVDWDIPESNQGIDTDYIREALEPYVYNYAMLKFLIDLGDDGSIQTIRIATWSGDKVMELEAVEE